MINTDDLCMSCMKEIGNAKQCPHCGFQVDSLQSAPYLQIRTVVSNRYLVGKLLEYNGEGATYIGWDLTNRVAVSIREFLPDAISTRSPGYPELRILPGREATFHECCQSFLEMWRQLARLRGLSALISVVDIVEDYATAYSISEDFDGVALRDFLLSSKTGYITWEKARQLFMPVLSTLGTLHSSGIIHRGISPTTLFMGRDGKIRISGFSIWQARTEKSPLNPQLFNGYAAIEQYGNKGKQGVWTDIYAFAAVLYRALIGSDPLDSPAREVNDRLMIPAKFAEQIPAYVVNALINALQIQPGDRTRSVEQLRAELSASPSAAAAGEVFNQPPKPEPKPLTKKTLNPEEKKYAKALAVKTGLISLAAGMVLFSVLALSIPSLREVFFSTGSSETTISSSTSASDTFSVPDFASLGTYQEISSSPLWSGRFTFKADFVYDSKIKFGTIISQSVEADTVVDKGTEITLTVSKGKEMVELPDVTGMDYTLAETQLKALGFECIRKDKTNDGSGVANTVIALSPLPSSPTEKKAYGKGTVIYLQVWSEIETTTSAGETTIG